MKDLSKLIIRIIAIASAGIPTAAAQETQQYDFSTIRINGLEVDKAYTREQIIDALGEPSIERTNTDIIISHTLVLIGRAVVDRCEILGKRGPAYRSVSPRIGRPVHDDGHGA